MTWYAQHDHDNNVFKLVESDDPPDEEGTFTPVTSLPGPRPGPRDGMVLKLIGQSVVWLDARTQQQRDIDSAAATDLARAAAYPPLEDLADAMYWQSVGEHGPMQAYLAAVAAVKTRIPKPKEK